MTEIVPAATPARASVPLAGGGWPATTIGRWRTIAIGSILAGASLVVAASLTLSGPTDRAEQRGAATLAPPSPATSQIAIDPVADPSGTDHGKGRGNGKGKSH